MGDIHRWPPAIYSLDFFALLQKGIDVDHRRLTMLATPPATSIINPKTLTVHLNLYYVTSSNTIRTKSTPNTHPTWGKRLFQTTVKIIPPNDVPVVIMPRTNPLLFENQWRTIPIAGPYMIPHASYRESLRSGPFDRRV